MAENAVNKDNLIDIINAISVGDNELTPEDVSYLVNYLLTNGVTDVSPRDLIQIRRGDFEQLPNLAQGELGFTLDTKKLYVGGLNGNVDITEGLVTKNEVEEIVFGDTVSPDMFGAVGDGTTDDTIAVQAAINTGKPVIFKKPYAVTSVEVNINGSRYIDFNGYYLAALSDDFVLKINTMYASFHNIIINGNLRPNLAGCMKIYSGASGVGFQAQFLTFNNTYLLNAPLGIQYGDGTVNAQSENNFNRLLFRSIIRGINVNQPNGFLQITNSELDITPYEWQTVPVEGYLINQTIGGVFISNSTLEAPSGGRALIGGDFNINNCIIEFPSIIFEFSGSANANANCNISDCNIYKSQVTPLFTSNIPINVNLRNVYSHGVTSLLHYSATNGLIKFTFSNCRFDQFMQGAGAKVLSCNNSVFGDSNNVSHPLVPIEYTANAEFKKASKEIVLSFKAKSNVASSDIPLVFCRGETIVTTTVIATATAVENNYVFHLRPTDDFDTVQLGIVNGILSDIILYTVNDGKNFTSSIAPSVGYYPTGTLITNTGSSSPAKAWLWTGTAFVAI